MFKSTLCIGDIYSAINSKILNVVIREEIFEKDKNQLSKIIFAVNGNFCDGVIEYVISCKNSDEEFDSWSKKFYNIIDAINFFNQTIHKFK